MSPARGVRLVSWRIWRIEERGIVLVLKGVKGIEFLFAQAA